MDVLSYTLTLKPTAPCFYGVVICTFTEYTATPTILQLVGFGVSPYPVVGPFPVLPVSPPSGSSGLFPA